MSSNREQFTTEIFVNNEQAQDATAKLTAKLEKQTQAYERLRAELGDFDKKTLKAKKSMEDTKASLDHAKTGVETYRKAIENLNDRSISQLVKMQKQLKRELDKTKPNTEEWKWLSKEYQQVTGRIESLKKAQQGVVKEGDKSATAFGRFFKKVNDFYGGITIYAKAIKVDLQAVIGVTKQVVNASQTMSDKWNNGMAAMKTSTDAFFMALSTGDWSAFNDGLAEALKKARELAELEDLLGSFRIAEGYIQSKDVVDIQEARNTATDTEADIEQRKQALEDMKAAIERYNEFVTAKGEATYQDLIKSFDAWKGITFNSEEEFKSFFDRLFRYSTTNRDEELARAQKSYEYTWKNLSARHKDAYGQIVQDYTAAEAKEIALEQVTKQYGEETAKLLQAVEINDEKHTKLVQTYAQYANSVQVVNQQTRTYQRTRDQVNKQLYSEELKQLQKANNVTLNIWKAQYAKGIIDKATFEAKKLELEQQAQQQSIELANKYGQDATDLYTKQLDDIIKQMEDEAKKAVDAADKAYQAAMKRVEKQESEQKLVWKRQYANCLIDKQLYEARIAEVEEDFLKLKMETAIKYGKDTDQFMNQLLDRQITRMEAAKALLKEEMEEMAKYYEQLQQEDFNRFGHNSSNNEGLLARDEYFAKKAAEIRAAITEDSARERYETEMKWIEKLHKDGLLSDEEYGQAVMNERLGFAGKIAQEVNKYAQMASDFATNLKEMETAKLEAEYQAQLTAAGDNAEEREAIEAEYEQKKLDLQKKYADTEMVINIAKAIAAGALAAIEAFAAAGNPILGAVFAANIAATTALEVATIVKQRNAIKNTSPGGGGSSSVPSSGTRAITGHAEGGFTENHTTLSTVGEEGTEWIAPHWMVRDNPTTFANLEQYRKTGSHGRSGSVSRGFADGGFTGSAPKDLSTESDAAIERAVFNGIRAALQNRWIRAFLVRKDLTDMDNQDERFKDQLTR